MALRNAVCRKDVRSTQASSYRRAHRISAARKGERLENEVGAYLAMAWPWSLQAGRSSKANISLDLDKPLNNATPRSLKVDLNTIDPTGKDLRCQRGLLGGSAWTKGESYHLIFYARTDRYNAPLTASLVGADGKTLASCTSREGGRQRLEEIYLHANSNRFGSEGKVPSFIRIKRNRVARLRFPLPCENIP